MLGRCIDRLEIVCVEQIFISIIIAAVCLQRSVILVNHLLEIVVFHLCLIWVRLISSTLLRVSVYAATCVRWYAGQRAVSGASFD